MMDFGRQEYSPLTRWSMAFMALYAAAEGCIIPFLSIYLRQLGLTSFYVGIILGIRVLVAALFGPVWRHLSRKYGRQKSLVLLSVLAGLALRIGLALIIPISCEYPLEYCNGMPGQQVDNSTTPGCESSGVTTQGQWDSDSHTDIWEAEAMNDDPILRTQMSSSDEQSEGSLFITVLLVVSLGELFASSGFQLVRVSLYHHLDNTDNFNLFPIAMSIWTISGGLSAAVISAAVDQAPCIILDGRSSMVIQIACSAVFLIAVSAVSYFLPLFEPHSLLHSTNRATKAFSYLCSNIHHFLLMVNSAFMGILLSAFSGFLFWHLQDLGGTAFSMGFFLLVESSSQCIVRMKGALLLRKLGHLWIIGLNFGCLAVTYFYVALIGNSWMATLIGVIGGLVLTLFWKAASDSLEETAPPGLYLHMFKHLEIIHAIGTAIGYISVGFLVDVIRLKLVFVIFGALSIIWGGVASVAMYLFPRKENVHYAKLFESQGNGHASATDSEEDWLEKAVHDNDDEEL